MFQYYWFLPAVYCDELGSYSCTELFAVSFYKFHNSHLLANASAIIQFTSIMFYQYSSVYIVMMHLWSSPRMTASPRTLDKIHMFEFWVWVIVKEMQGFTAVIIMSFVVFGGTFAHLGLDPQCLPAFLSLSCKSPLSCVPYWGLPFVIVHMQM